MRVVYAHLSPSKLPLGQSFISLVVRKQRIGKIVTEPQSNAE